MAKDPNAVAQKWVTNLGSSGESITRGVQSVTTAPGAAAARQKSQYVQGVTQNADKWATRVASVSVDDWRQSMINKGIPRIASGAAASQGKFQTFMGQLLPYIESGRGNLPQRGNLDQNIARMTAWARYMAGFQRRS